MNQAYENLNKTSKILQEPLEAIMNLNKETLQNFGYIKFDEFIKFKKPEELFDKQITLALENGQHALNYLQQSFNILSQATLDLIHTAKENKV